MRARLTLTMIVVLSAAAFAQSSQPGESSAEEGARSGAESRRDTEVAPATRTGPKVAPENERPIARTPRSTPSSLPSSDCVGAVNTTECLSKATPPKTQPDAGAVGDAEAQPGSDSGDLLESLRPPRSDEGVSSSRDTGDGIGDLGAGGEVNEMYPFDPHKAAKDIEVGEFYLKRKNFRAAISRFRGALRSKPNDALATFRLAEALEGDKQLPEAAKNYSMYLDILPTGEYAVLAREALDRLEIARQAAVPAK